ncbi:ABC transporter transmembrane domain-containing protein [Halosaccharopolyspora lacisalsi]
MRLRAHVFHHLQRLSPAFFARRRTGDLVSRLSETSRRSNAWSRQGCWTR